MFYVPGRGWVAAGDLNDGDEVYLIDGSAAYVTGAELEKLAEPVTVYNLEVEGLNTYFVGDDGVLVHNYKNEELGIDVNASELSSTNTVSNHTDRNFYMDYPNTVIENIMEGSTPIEDPQGVKGAWRWDTPGAIGNTVGVWELVVDVVNKVILHFNFNSKK